MDQLDKRMNDDLVKDEMIYYPNGCVKDDFPYNINQSIAIDKSIAILYF